MPDQREEDAKKELLRVMYEAFRKDPRASAYNCQLPAGADENLTRYVATRFEGVYWDLESTVGMGGILYGKIRPEGIQALRALGHPTILDDNMRFRILLHARDQAKTKGIHTPCGLPEVAKALNTPEDEVWPNACYLAAEGLVDLELWGVGELTITQRGMEQGESFEQHGGEPPEGHAPFGGYQHIIGPNQRAKAEQIFREQVEMARKEIIIVDPYAKTPLYDWLKHVPAGVNVKILTTDRAFDANYQGRVRHEKAKHNLEVRWVPYAKWGLHGRFLFRDGVDAWSWDASFHDAGKARHTLTELAPVNRQINLTAFNNQWSSATEIK